ncbi:hypothetical protein [Micromonospora sp. DT41]|uniref:hypothetical protein n=1 Tax=Micromonospora sp. DT41 TaxID=3393437 RepID=UPI003CF38E21
MRQLAVLPESMLQITGTQLSRDGTPWGEITVRIQRRALAEVIDHPPRAAAAVDGIAALAWSLAGHPPEGVP